MQARDSSDILAMPADSGKLIADGSVLIPEPPAPLRTTNMKLPNELRDQRVEALTPLYPDKVILFGSYAWGEPTADSDIDLYVVTQDDFMPTTWRQKSDIVRTVSNRILNLRTCHSIDLLVHTKPMHRKFIETSSSFAREIMERGARLL